MASDDTPSAVLTEPADPGLAPGADGAPAVPERTCVLTGAHGERKALIRLVIGPDGALWPDLGAKLPGRGAWITPDRAKLEAAMARGKLKGALARTLKTPVLVPEDLPTRLADGLERRALDRMGLELRAGHLIFGSEKLTEWARAGRLFQLLHAGDAAADGISKLNQAFRSGGGDMSDVFCLPAGRVSLSRALGRDNMVHSGVTDKKAAARIQADVMRWLAYLGLASDGNDELKDDGSGVSGRRSDEGRE
jgi:predicted RNA-binding protein YlxR (DUF448 family)